MNLAKKLLMTTGTSSGTVPTPSGGYVDDVFSAYTYTGNGSTQTINNGIDLAGEGGLVWTKSRTSTTNNYMFDTNQGANNVLYTNSSAGNSGTSGNSFLSNGFSTTGASLETNVSGTNYVSWTFRKAPKFFDIVTYTGNGATGRQIAHSLGVQAGFITVKSTSTTGDWNSYHRSATGDLKLNLTDAQTASRTIITAADASTFTVSGTANNNGVSYVAYLWAHDPSADGIIQCGSFAYSSGTLPVNLGWEPQYVLVKLANQSGNWETLDAMRGLSVSKGTFDSTKILRPNMSGTEQTGEGVTPTPTGVEIPPSSRYANSGDQHIYLAIRRPNKPPTIGTQVYNASTASGVVSAGFPVDLHIGATRAGAASNHAMHARLTGGTRELVTSSTAAEATITDLGFDIMTGLRSSLPAGGVNHFFRRATGFMDVVYYTGTGSATTVAHNLGAVPELMIVKGRNNSLSWPVYHRDIGNGNYIALNLTDPAQSGLSFWNSTTPSASAFTLGGSNGANQGGYNYVAYLFASLPGISKVGSYSGNGGTQTIPCGFTTGSRFILIRRIDNTGDWFVWDTARGITPTTDPHLSLNTVAAEVTTDDSIDQDASGFVVNQNAATNINALGGNYLFLAIA